MDVFAAASACLREGPPGVLVTVLAVAGSAPRHGGARMLVLPHGELRGTIGGGELEHRAIQEALRLLGAETPRRISYNLTRDLGMCCGGLVELHLEPLNPRPTLTLFGAGHVAHAVAQLAHFVGFRVRVVDERDDLNNVERFPHAEIIVDDPHRWSLARPAEPEGYALVVTHAHALDQALVELWLPRPFAWLGLIGSRAKLGRFLVRLRAAGVDEALFQRLSSPVGLDLGAETPEEIAVAVVAELVRVRRGHLAPPLPLSEQPLPARGGDGRAEAPRLSALRALSPPGSRNGPRSTEAEPDPPASR